MYFHITKKVKQESKIKLASRFLPYHACTAFFLFFCFFVDQIIIKLLYSKLYAWNLHVPSIAVSDTTLCPLAVRALGNKVYPQKPRFKPLLVGKITNFFSYQASCIVYARQICSSRCNMLTLLTILV